MNQLTARRILGLLLASLPLPALAQSPAEELDASWVAVCAGASPGSTFETRCAEILNAGPGIGNRRSEAATGNNLDTLSSQGRVTREEDSRGAALVLGKVSFHASSQFAPTSWEATAYENGYDSDRFDLALGADWPLGEVAVLGFTLARSTVDTTYDENAGALDADTYLLTGYASVAAAERQRVDAYVAWGKSDYDVARNIDYTLVLNAGQPGETTTDVSGIAVAEPEGSQSAVGAAWEWDALAGATTFGPTLRADWEKVEVDAYRETGGAGLSMSYGKREASSLRAEAGAALARSFSRNWGVLSPQGYAAYGWEFDDDQTATYGAFNGDTNSVPVAVRTQYPDRNYVRAGVSLAAIFRNGWIAYASLDGLFGHRYESRNRLAIGLRKEM